MTRLLVASTNAGKVAEIAPVVASFGYEPVGLDAFPDVAAALEDADTFAGNARSKALHYCAATGLPTLADDSGLEVDALGGAPGVHSARYAGPEQDDRANLTKLLAMLDGVAARDARFRCALCLARPGDDGPEPEIEVDGVCEGTIAGEPRGSGGFGYDPVFVASDPAAGGRTFAEMDRDEKAAFSHRGAALAALREALAAR